jgi:hypothetical protein
MNSAFWISLTQTTLRTPSDAAEQVMGLKLPRDVLWTALALVALFNTLAFLLATGVSPQVIPLPVGMEQPFIVYLLLTGMMVLYVNALQWAGCMIGGEGRLDDVLAVIIWFQALRAAAQFLLLLCGLFLPFLSNLLALVVIAWGLWILMSFVKTASRLPSIGHAIGALLLAGVILIIGLGALTGILGGLLQGVIR